MSPYVPGALFMSRNDWSGGVHTANTTHHKCLDFYKNRRFNCLDFYKNRRFKCLENYNSTFFHQNLELCSKNIMFAKHNPQNH